MSDKFIGKFTAPGTGAVDVLSIDLTHDLNAGNAGGVIRLAERPYWEGGATPFMVETPSREYGIMRLTGLWIERGLFDGEGCDIAVVNVRALPNDCAMLEVNGKTYPLTRAAMRDNRQTYTASAGERYTMRIGRPRMEATTPDIAAQSLGAGGPHPCRVTMGGAGHTGLVWVNGWSHSDQEVHLTIEEIQTIPATSALDETTDPADLDWGAIRSACDRRDWREAWGVVGTDHVGDATPGEVYVLSVARHKSATAAALWQWRAEFKATVDGARNEHNAKRLRSAKAWRDIAPLPLGEEAWQRIKGIAAWESSARAQYDERGNRRGRLQAAVREQLINATRDVAAQARLYGRDNAGDELLNALRQIERATQADGATVRPTDMWIDEATFDALRQRSEDDALTRDGRGVVGVLNNPYLSAAAQRGEIAGTVTIPPSSSSAVADALARYASMTGNTMNVQGDGRSGIVVTPRNANPAPRGPQTRRRRR